MKSVFMILAYVFLCLYSIIAFTEMHAKMAAMYISAGLFIVFNALAMDQEALPLVRWLLVIVGGGLAIYGLAILP